MILITVENVLINFSFYYFELTAHFCIIVFTELVDIKRINKIQDRYGEALCEPAMMRKIYNASFLIKLVMNLKHFLYLRDQNAFQKFRKVSHLIKFNFKISFKNFSKFLQKFKHSKLKFFQKKNFF